MNYYVHHDSIWSKKRQWKKATGLRGRQWVKYRKALQRAAKAEP